MPTILVIDDSEAVRTALDVLFNLNGNRVLTADSPASGLAIFQREQIDLVLQDMNFRREATSGDEGAELYRQIRAIDPEVPVILLTAWTHLEAAVGLVKAGASDYLGKPWEDTKLLTTVRNLLALRKATLRSEQLQLQRARSRDQLAQKYDLRGIVFESDAMRDLIAMAAQVAPSDAPILITGPNGSGKELLAAIVQANSAVRDRPFVKVNVGALPRDLMEAELFGAEPGAYTGATKTRVGRFEAADGGTLFLDEIGTLSLEGQAKLLRVLQAGEFQRLGSSTTRHAKVRLITATNSDLRQAIANGGFREDVYYRINVIELRVPPLDEKMDDVLPLARYFLTQQFELDAAAERSLLAHRWPGNVRELENTMRRAALLAKGRTLTAADLGLPVATAVEQVEREPDRSEVEAALLRARGVIARAARELGLSRQALYRRMEKLGIKE